MPQNIYYQEEKQYASTRLTVLFILAFFSFILFEQVNTEMVSKMFLVKMSLAGLVLVSMSHYLLVMRRPSTLVEYRKILLILLDLAALTFFIAILEENGLFLLPLYIMIDLKYHLSRLEVYFQKR